jgi:hypothetical protein
MKQMSHSFILQLSFWIVPVFIIWKFTASTIITPVIININDAWLKYNYHNLGAEIVQIENSEKWKIKTRLFLASKPYGNYTRQPSIRPTSPTFIIIGEVYMYTQSLAIFWLLIFIMSRQKIKHFFLGTAILVILISIIMMLMSSYHINTLLMVDGYVRVLFPGKLVLAPDIPPTWYVTLLKTIFDGSFYGVLSFAPLGLSLLFCRPFLYAAFFACMLQYSSVNQCIKEKFICNKNTIVISL